jgi:membrane AbrB-like protein
MTSSDHLPLAKFPRWTQWLVLASLSLALAALFRLVRLPAALLLGPMIAGILVESGGGKVRVPELPFAFAQAVIGCLIARMITADIVTDFLRRWPILMGVVLAVILASSALGFIMSKWKVLPDTTAVWGLLPGAASAMMLMAGAFGADIRLVAFMQYLRVVMVASAASLVARFWVHLPAGTVITPIPWFPEIHWLAFGATLALVVVGVFLGRRLPIPAGTLLLPMAAGTAFHLGGIFSIELPPWFLGVSYALLGWSIGLRFTRDILARAARALPQVVLSILLLMGFCGLLSWLLVKTLGLDALTAYLATSPGGMDSVAIIVASSPGRVDVPFVMALQTMRFLLILVVGPPLSRWVAKRVKG